MHIRHVSSSRRARRVLASVGIVGVALAAAACGSDDSGSGSSGSGGNEKIGVALITKDSSNPFFVAMQKGAKADAVKENVDITVASGKQEGDDQGQITAIEDAIARGDKGILITPMSTGVNAAIKKARDAGLYVIALDTPPDPANTVDITFATDNREAGKHTGGKGGDYTIVCNEAGQGAEDGGRTAMEKCLAKNPNINLVYTINEPTAVGANAALKAANKTALMVSVDGGCAGVGSVKSGVIGATAQQYPLKMATLGMEAIAKIARGGTKPTTSPGLDFYNTGVALVTDKPVQGVDSITSDQGAKICWGN